MGFRHSFLRRLGVALAAATMVVPIAVPATASAATGDDVLINELIASTTSTDVEFIELIGTPGFSLDGLSIIGVEADVDADGLGGIDFRFDFDSSNVLGSNGYYLLGNESVLATYGVEPDTVIAENSLENSSATYALVATADLAAGLPATTLDAVHLTDDDIDPPLLGAPSVGPDGTFLPAGVGRVAEGVDTDTAGDWAFGDFFNGSDNTPTAGGGVPEPSATSIMDIQGAGHLSTVAGELVVTSGVVTGVAFNGFYLQDPDGDGDDTTSDGIFVFAGSNPGVMAGDVVSVTGSVSEFIPGGAGTGNLSITQISASDFAVIGTAPLPAPVEIGRDGRLASSTTVISNDELPVNLQDEVGNFDHENDAIDFWETLEGMRVEVDQPVTVSATRTFNEFSSELFALPSRGRTVAPRDARTKRGGIELQPDVQNTGDQNPERVQIQFDGTLYPAPVPALNINTQLADVVGVVGYSFGNYEVNATEEVIVRRASKLRAEVTPFRSNKKHLTLASYNVLNLSGDGSDIEQMAVVAEHIAVNLKSPDIVALQEIQDDSGDTDDGVTSADGTLAALVAAIEAAGGPTYVAANVDPVDGTQGGIPGGNIRNAYLYNPERVSLIELQDLNSDYLTSVGVTDPGAFDGTRVPLLATFKFRGDEITVINNHFTSRFGSTPVYGGIQPFVQAGEAERETESTTINEVVDVRLAADADANIAVVGDLNTFQWTDELVEDLPGSDQALTNLALTALHGADRDDVYSFVFDGNSQLLDHMFVSGALAARAPKFDIVHVNVDFARVDDSTGSDHEPLLARFRF